MGNRFSMKKRNGRRRPVEERFTRPQRLVCEPANVDYKKLKKLILTEKLAPCFEGVEDSNPDLEECPICFFYFPSLNRSKCCMKGICTECFLQMKPANSSRPAQCPFCKFSIYAVEYRGAKTKEEKILEQAEEQKVIEAKLRMQSEESEDVNRVTLGDRISSEVEVQSPLPYIWQLPNHSGDAQDAWNSHISRVQERSEQARHEEFDMDLEEIMIAEAIWLSVQDLSVNQSGEPSRSSPAMVNQGEISSAESVTGGLAFAIARFAEQNVQHSDAIQAANNNNHIQRTTHENSLEEYDSGTFREIPDEMRRAGDSACLEPNDMASEDGGYESSLTTNEDSWEDLPAHNLDESAALETTFVSDEDPEEIAANSSCPASSIHTVSERSFGSPDCFDDNEDAGSSHLSANIPIQKPIHFSNITL